MLASLDDLAPLSDMGMSGLFVVGDANGVVSDATLQAIQRWKTSEKSHHH
ncbi:MAG: hypothetical protein JJE05_11700 [Actinobacteria bacterium]|nr:hypothetical protein [Actinomycetota bacterium]